MKKALDIFGEEFIHSVLDNTVTKYGNMIFQRRTRGITAQFVNEQLKGFSEEQRNAVYLVMEKAVEDATCNMLDLFEQNEEFQLTINMDGTPINLNEVSDGLSGELFGDDGWINKFSSIFKSKE